MVTATVEQTTNNVAAITQSPIHPPQQNGGVTATRRFLTNSGPHSLTLTHTHIFATRLTVFSKVFYSVPGYDHTRRAKKLVDHKKRIKGGDQ